MSQRRSKRPSREEVAAIKQARPAAALVWGREAELDHNRRGELHPDQRKRIARISIFDPWVRLVFGAFLVVFALTQQPSSWQFWLPLAIALLPLGSAINGLLARRRLDRATVETIEGSLAAVKPHRSEAVAATLHRDRLYMFLLNYDGAGALPAADRPYRFYVVFNVLRPGIVLAVEEIGDR
ncbi:MAG TPA: hypothetical protein VD886_15960 [Herpetosiphonaceae bacterium]|nr:hypothetical protein [Herpetosiphonaceae bacterium]